MTVYNPSIEDTIAFVTDIHKGQSHSGKPYVEHCLRVAMLVPADLIIPALLHDTVEDYGGKPQPMLNYLRYIGYSEDHVRTVDLCTHYRGVSRELYIARVCTTVPSLTLKIADLMDNVDAIDLEQDPIVRDRRSRKYKRDILQIKAALPRFNLDKQRLI